MAGAIALITLAACSSDSPTTAGSTTIPNATAEVSSSSESPITSSADKIIESSADDVIVSSSNEVTTSSSDNAITSSASEKINSSSSNNETIGKQDIIFTTTPTAKKAISQGEVVVYGNENGAHASCSAGKYASTKEYDAKISIADGKTTERTLWLRNFGDACKDILKSFKESCSIGKTVVSQDAACNDNGNLKVFCFATNTDSIGDFNVIIEDFTKQSNEICGSIADGVDSTEYDLPVSEPDSNIKANSGRKFIIAPNTENLEVSDEERTILDSLAKAFPQKSTTDPIDGMTLLIHREAQYNFTTKKERYTIPEEDNPYFCIVDVYQEESGLIRSFTPNSRGTLLATTLLTPDNSIAYLAYGEVYSSVGPAKSLFKEECEATNGSFYDYYPNDGKVAVACAVKNFTGIPFETIVSEQQSLCDNDYKSF